MSIKSNNENLQSDFAAKYEEYPDIEIITILKKREHYQKDAVKAAIEEALKRGLIHSEQDLFAEEFRPETLRFTFFPFIENELARNKTIKSIARSLIIIGAIPVVWGAYKIYQNQLLEGIILLLLGLLWVFISVQIMKNAVAKRLNVLFLMLVAAMAYLSKLLYTASTVTVFDVFFVIAIGLLVLYGLLFLRKLS